MKSSTPPMYVHSPPFPDWFIWQYKKTELRGKVGFFLWENYHKKLFSQVWKNFFKNIELQKQL